MGKSHCVQSWTDFSNYFSNWTTNVKSQSLKAKVSWILLTLFKVQYIQILLFFKMSGTAGDISRGKLKDIFYTFSKSKHFKQQVVQNPIELKRLCFLGFLVGTVFGIINFLSPASFPPPQIATRPPTSPRDRPQCWMMDNRHFHQFPLRTAFSFQIQKATWTAP